MWTREAVPVKVRVDLEPIEVGDHQQRRVVERLAVVVELPAGRLQVLALALVLPREVAALPDVGEAATAVELLGPFSKGVGLPRRVRVMGRWLAEHPADVDELATQMREFAFLTFVRSYV